MSDQEKQTALKLFADYEAADQAVEDAKLAHDNAIERRSFIVQEIAGFTGKEGEKKWRGRSGEIRKGKIVKRVSEGGNRTTWFFKGLNQNKDEQDFTA